MTELRSGLHPETVSGHIVDLDPGRDDDRWAEWVRSCPDALVYHHPAYTRALQRAYGYRSACLGFEDRGGALRGVLPLLETHGLVTGTRLSSLPHTPVAGPLADCPEATAELLGAALEQVRARGARLQVKSPHGPRAEHVDGLACVRWDDTFVLDLPERTDDLRFGNSRNDARIRWAVRKASKQGVSVRDARSEADLRAWYRLYLETMRSHAVPPRSYRHFAALWALLAPLGMMRLLLAERAADGRVEPIAGSVILRCGQTATYAFTGERREARALRPNDLIQSAAIRELAAAGVRSYDLGEVGADQAGLAEYKRKWGAQPRPLYRYHEAPGRPSAVGAPVPRGALRTAGERVWRQLPLPVTARVGEWLYRRL